MEQPGDLLLHDPVCQAGLLPEHLGRGVLVGVCNGQQGEVDDRPGAGPQITTACPVKNKLRWSYKFIKDLQKIDAIVSLAMCW